MQRRALTGIHIWGSGGKGSKPAVVIHGTVHAREWITTMTTEYFAWQLLTKYAGNATVKALVDKFDYYIIPVVNPDGIALPSHLLSSTITNTSRVRLHSNYRPPLA